MTENSLQQIMNPRSIVFFGASNNILTMGTAQLLNILKEGYQGEVFAVHPTEEKVLGLKTYKSVSALPRSVDLAVMVLPTRIVPKILSECGRKGIKSAIIISGGFREVGEVGEELQDEIVSVARKHGIRFLGPNCIGVLNAHRKFNSTWFPYGQEPGRIGLASQSGTYVCHTFGHLSRLGIRLSQAISVGNEADIDLVEAIEYLANDTQTRVIALYIEGIRKGREFVKLASEITTAKPIVALYVGGSKVGARASYSHTAALSGPDELYDGVFRQAGVIRAQTIEELFDLSWALATQPLPKGKEVAIVTNSGGVGVSMADACIRWRLDVPRLSESTQKRIREFIPHTASSQNPVDLTFMIDVDAFFGRITKALLEDPEINGILIYGVFGPLAFKKMKELAGDLLDIPFEQIELVQRDVLKKFIGLLQRYGKPVLGCSFLGRDDSIIALLQDSGIPFYPSPERAVKAMAALFQYARIRARRKG